MKIWADQKLGNAMRVRTYIHAPELPSSRISEKFIMDRLNSSGVDGEIIRNSPHPKYYEYPTLRKIWEDSKHDDFYVLYMHLKGSSKVTADELENAKCWMDYMLYGVVDNWSICTGHLDAGADLVGSQWHWHFKGNFWWAKSSYLRSLPDPLTISTDRFAAEYWCCWGFWRPGFSKPAVKNLFYLDGVNNDNVYTLARGSSYPPDLKRKISFIDHEIDGRHAETIDHFMKRKYYCSFDQIYIPSSKIHLIMKLSDFLNYDGHVCIGENLYDTISKSWKELNPS